MLKIYKKILEYIFTSGIILLFFTSFIYAQSEFHLSGEFSFTTNDVTGAGSASSSLSEGIHYLNTLNMNLNGKTEKFDYNLNIGTKITDDRRNDIKTFSLTNFQAKFTNKFHTLNLGDTFESFSQYSLSSGLKGISYRYSNEDLKLTDLAFVYGLAYSRWDSLWHSSKTKTIERKVYGGQIKYNLSPDLWMRFNIVTSSDDNRLNSTDQLYDNTIYVLDIEYKPLPRLTIKTETAFNDTEESPSSGASSLKYHGYAHKIEAVGDADPSRVTFEYEKVSSDFQTLLGSATPDREKFKIKWRYKYSKLVNINTGYLWFRNNLDGKKSYTTKNYKPEIGITIKKPFKREYSTLDISYKINKRSGGNTNTSDKIINLNLKDRFGIFDNDTNFGYTRYETKTNVRKNNEYIYNTSFSLRKTSGQFVFKPSLYLGAWTSEDELNNTKDKTYEYSLGLGIDVPSKKITSNFKVGQNKLTKDNGDDTKKNIFKLKLLLQT